MHAMCMPVACGGQKRELDPLELELHEVVSRYVDAGNWTLDPLEEHPLLLITEPFLKLPTLAFLKNILCILREFHTCIAMSFDGIHDLLTPSEPHIASSSKFFNLFLGCFAQI